MLQRNLVILIVQYNGGINGTVDDISDSQQYPLKNDEETLVFPSKFLKFPIVISLMY